MAKNMSIADIAKIAGVSVSTVSRSLQDSSLISQKTKDKINAIAEKHNFRINARARNFRTQKSHVIGMLSNMDHAEKQESSDQFLFRLVNSISANLFLHKYDLLLYSNPIITADMAAAYVHDQKVDGLIIYGQGKNQHQEITVLSETDVPFVVWGGYADDQYTTVGSDNFRGGYIATKHLIERCGKKKLIFLGAPQHLEISQRYGGYQKALSEAGLRAVDALDDRPAFCLESGYAATEHLIEARVVFDGLICASDTIALGAINCLRKHGIAIPQEVAVIGYDDIAFAKDWSPSLTTVHQNVALGAQLLVNKILAKISGESIRSSQMDVTVIERDSA